MPIGVYLAEFLLGNSKLGLAPGLNFSTSKSPCGRISRTLLSPPSFEITGDAALVWFEVKKERAFFKMWVVVWKGSIAPARIATVRAFDFNHVSPIIGEEFVAIWPGNVMGQIEHGKTCESLLSHYAWVSIQSYVGAAPLSCRGMRASRAAIARARI